MYFVEVIVPLPLEKTFTYKVSETEFHFIKPGMRIIVSFGNKKKHITAIVISLHQNPPLLYEAKEIAFILDETPLITTTQINFWFWISSYYMCFIGEVFKAALPSALLLESESLLILNQKKIIDTNLISDDEFLIVEALQIQSVLKIVEIQAILGKKNIFNVIEQLLQKGIVEVKEEIVEVYRPKKIKCIKIHPDYESGNALKELLENKKVTEKQLTLIKTYFLLNTILPLVEKKVLLERASMSSVTLKKLIEKGIFIEYHNIQDRTDYIANNEDKKAKLSLAQTTVYQEIQSSFKTKNIALLHGVTSSGKTEVYTQIIDDFLLQNKQVLFLVPEIALTTQLVARMRLYFGNKIAVYHSKFNSNERVEVWHQIASNSEKAQLIIGARSALFLPFTNLGLVIIDEEHEVNYKQTDPAPRYNARDAAMVLAKLFDAKVLLGSATPSIETYYHAKEKKYAYISLSERYGDATLPEINIIDLKEAYFKKKMKGHFSEILLEEIAKTLQENKQVILFQNRRGFAPVLECLTCGHIPMCAHCDVSLTYHQYKNQLRCHYCGYHIAKPVQCHQCSSKNLTTKGVGTEQIEQEIASFFPNEKVQRMDQDTTQTKNSFSTIINAFQQRKVSILVGTQMLAKGLDFDNVGLVAVINADNLLYYPDFRAIERCYQLITQVAGRAGRSSVKGKVFIQTFSSQHHIFKFIIENEYEAMFREQLHQRKIFEYPPFSRILRHTLKCSDYEVLKNASQWLFLSLKNALDCPVLGPEEPVVSKIRNEYLKNIVIKLPVAKAEKQKKTIQKILNSFYSISQFKKVKVITNVDVY